MNDISNLARVVLPAGHFRLGTETKGGTPLGLAKLRIFPSHAESTDGGRWLLRLDLPGDIDPKSKSRAKEEFSGVAARLGLIAPRLAEPFRQALQSPKPLALIADTSALYTGVFEQAVRMRQGLPTHLAIPDQVYMELQRQREPWGAKRRDRKLPSTKADHLDQTPPPDKQTASAGRLAPVDEWLSQRRGAPPFMAIERVLSRLQNESGQVLHQTRPADSLVRYFGGERGAGAEEDDLSEGAYEDGDDRIAANFYRDRLILEAVRAEQIRLHQLPMWLVTSDEKLAVHAQLEGFLVGYGQRAQSPDPWLVGSPWVDAHTLSLRHISAGDFIAELIQQWGTVTLQEEGKGLLQVWKRTPAAKQALASKWPFTKEDRQREGWHHSKTLHGAPVTASHYVQSQQIIQAPLQTPTYREVAHAAMQFVSPPQQSASGFTGLQSSTAPANFSLSSQDPPTQQPALPMQVATMPHLLNALLACQEKQKSSKAPELAHRNIEAYLLGLGWIRIDAHLANGDQILRITESGNDIAKRWLALSPQDLGSGADWAKLLADIATLFYARTPLAKLIDTLPGPGKGGLTRTQIEPLVQRSRAALGSQIALGQLWGVLVSWDGLIYRVHPATQQEAAQAIRGHVRETVRVDSLFLKMLKNHPLGLPSFRSGLLALYQSGQLTFGGGLPSAAGSEHKPVKLPVIVPTVELPRKAEQREIDLADGDFLLPSVSCQVVSPRESI